MPGYRQAPGEVCKITPVLMTNGLSYSSITGLRLNGVPGDNTCGVYFFQDARASKGITHQNRITDLVVDGGCATGYLIGYEANALCPKSCSPTALSTPARLYGFRNISSNALNNNLINCGGVGNAIWASAPTGSMQIFGVSSCGQRH